MIEKMDEQEIAEAIEFWVKQKAYVLIQRLEVVDIEFAYDRKTKEISAEIYTQEISALSTPENEFEDLIDEAEYYQELERQAGFTDEEALKESKKSASKVSVTYGNDLDEY